MHTSDQGRTKLDRTGMLAAGMMLGAGLMYLLDPGKGSSRRTRLRDQALHGSKTAQRQVSRQARNFRNHITGAIAENWARLRDSRQVFPDDVLEQRVFAQIGHVVQHPGRLQVSADDGHVTISGQCLPGEIYKIEQRLLQTRGVRSFDVLAEETAELERSA